MGESFNSKFESRLVTHTSKDNTLHSSGRTSTKSKILLQIEKATERSDGAMQCHVFRIEDVVAQLGTSDYSISVSER